jgi:membrane protein DedA with SNARE-associated domain
MGDWLGGLAIHHGLGVLYLAALLEGAGLPLPYELIFVAFGFLTQESEGHFLRGLLGLYLASTLGNGLGYWAGRFYGRRLLFRTYRRSPAARAFWRRLRHPRRRRQILLHLLALRWLGFGFGPALWLAGLQHTPPIRFFAAMAAINLPWTLAWGFFVRHAARLPHPLITLLVVGAVVVLLHAG